MTTRKYNPRIRVALLIETSNSYARGILRGIDQYVREHRPWALYLPEQSRGETPSSWLNRGTWDGMIVRVENEQILKMVKKSGIPAINVSTEIEATKSLMPQIQTDNPSVAKMGFDHLFERGFRHMAFCGDSRYPWSREREEAFRLIAAKADVRCEFYVPPDQAKGYDWERDQTALIAWAKSLPRPIGIFACFDIRGQHVLQACQQIGAAVPDEIAVLGVDNDELLCELSHPSLSSVIPDVGQIGYRAAGLLDLALSGETVAFTSIRLPPLGVETRQSTDALAVADPDVVQALRFIREHACEGIKVGAIVKELAMSRRALEYRFRRVLGCSPHEQILRVQLQRVVILLSETDLSLSSIADLTGFKHVEHLSVAFRRTNGISPREFRLRRRK